MKYIASFIILIILSIGIFLGLYKTETTNANILRLSMQGDPQTFNPIMIQDTTSSFVASFVFEGLTKLDGKTLEIKPCLAESWKVSSDNTVWTMNLRRDVFWSDGEKFTARDVVFTYNDLIYNEKIPTSSRDVLTINGKPIKVRQIDDYTVEFKLPCPFAPFLLEMSHSILPYHRLKDTVGRAQRMDYPVKPGNDKNVFSYTWGIDTKPEEIVGTGHYVLHKYLPGERIILKKNPLKKPSANIDYIAISIIPDSNSRMLKFIRGELDVFSILGQDYSYVKSHKNYKDVYDIVDIGAGTGSSFVVVNQDKTKVSEDKYKWFSNKKFRQAISHAIDRETIIDNVFYGLGVPQYGPMTNSNKIFYNQDILQYEYNPKKAREILDELNFDNIEINLLTNSESKVSLDICNIISDDLKKVGVKVNVVALQFSLLLNKLLVTGDWDMVCLGLSGGLDPHGGKNVWAIGGNLHFWNKSGEYFDWEQKIDDLFNKGAGIINKKHRKKVYDEWQFLVSEQLPMIYTAIPSVIYGINSRLKNVEPSVFGGMFHNIEELEIKIKIKSNAQKHKNTT